MARHLVTGADGFIGRHLGAALRARGESVTPLDRHQAGDLFLWSEADLASAVAGHDVVHHLAWSTIPQTSEADPDADLQGNIPLFRRVLAAAGREGARVVFASSGGTVYGRDTGAPFREDDPLRPVGLHGAAKAAAELYARAALAAGTDVRVARLSNPYGPGQGTARAQGVVSRFAGLALRGEPVEIWGDGTVVRDYLHIDDAVAGLIALAAAPQDALAPDPAVNIAGGQGTSLNQVVALLEEAVGHPIAVHRRPGRPFDIGTSILAIARAERLLGWRPRLPLRAGLARLVAALREG